MEQNSIDARGARLALRMYIKWSWVAVLALVGGFMLGSSLSSTTTIEGESTLVVGLTDEVRWPFYDAVLARQQGLIEDFELADKTAEATGIEHLSVVVEGENTQSSTLTIGVRVVGGAQDAATFANELGDLLVQANAEAQATSYVQEAEALQAQLDEQKLLEVGYETEIADLTATWVGIQDEIVVAEPEDIAELRGQALEVDRDRRVAERRLDGVIAYETTLITQLAAAERDAANTASTVEVSRSAAAVSGSATDLGPVLAILNFLLALLIVPFLERGLGRVNSIDQLALLFQDAKLIDNRFKDSGAVQPVDVVALSVKSLEARRHGSNLPESNYPPLVVAETGLSRATEEILEAVSVGGRRVSLVDLETPGGLDAAVEADQVVLVVPARTLRVGRAKELASSLSLLDASPEVVVLSKKASRGTKPREYGARAATSASLSPQAAGTTGTSVVDDTSDERRSESDRRGVERPAVPPPVRRRKMVSAHDASERPVDTAGDDAELGELLGTSEAAVGSASVGAAATKRRSERATRRTSPVTDNATADTAKPDADKAKTEKADADKSKADADKAKAEKAKTEKADADKAKAEKADTDKAKAEKADADKAKADKLKADADNAKADKLKADADKAKADADKAKADADKAKAEKAKTEKAETNTDQKATSTTTSKPDSAGSQAKTSPAAPSAAERRQSEAADRRARTRQKPAASDSVSDRRASTTDNGRKSSNERKADASISTSPGTKSENESSESEASSEPATTAKRRPRLPAKDAAAEKDDGADPKSTGKKTPAGSS